MPLAKSSATGQYWRINHKQVMVVVNLTMMIGQNIKLLRFYLNLSQEEFAKRIGLSKFTVLNYERGKTSPTVDNVEMIEDTFNVDLDTIKVVFDRKTTSLDSQ